MVEDEKEDAIHLTFMLSQKDFLEHSVTEQ
jgi:hypothetical protein